MERKVWRYRKKEYGHIKIIITVVELASSVQQVYVIMVEVDFVQIAEW